MDAFPEDIERNKCKEVLMNSQEELIRKTRENFTNSITYALNTCQKEVFLQFDERLWDDSKKLISTELIERFGEVMIASASNSSTSVSRNINDPENLPERIIKLGITF